MRVIEQDLEILAQRRADLLLRRAEYQDKSQKHSGTAYIQEQEAINESNEQQIVEMLKEFNKNYSRKYTAKDKVLF